VLIGAHSTVAEGQVLDRSALIGIQTVVLGPSTSKYKAVTISSFISLVEQF